MNRKGRKAVAPVLATLLMIAVAVAMSVIIFMWSQGFLSQTSGATGSQQGAQNQAAQSSVSIEAVTATASGFSNASRLHGNITIFVRNVGAVAVNLASVSVTGSSSNAGFNKSISATLSLPSGGRVQMSAIPSLLRSCNTNAGNPGTACATYHTLSGVGVGTYQQNSTAGNRPLLNVTSSSTLTMDKGGSFTLIFTLPTVNTGAFPNAKGFVLKSGDTLNIKVTTDVGTFAQTSLTVP